MNASHELRFEACDHEVWTEHFDQSPMSTLFQSWEFGEAMRQVEGQAPIRQCILLGDTPIGLIQAFETKWLGFLRQVRVLRGPLFLHPTPPQVQAITVKKFRAQFPISRGAWATIMPEIADSSDWQKAAQAQGLTRVMEGYETDWLDLSRSEDMLRKSLKQKWRNQLSRAEDRIAQEPTLELVENEDTDWLLETYDKDKKKRRYSGPSAALLRALPFSSHYSLSLRQSDRPIGGVHFIRHGTTATYQVGWTSDEGRELNAHNLLLWRATLAIKQLGHTWLDLGGIDPARMPGIAHFKRGLGGHAFHTAGVYL